MPDETRHSNQILSKAGAISVILWPGHYQVPGVCVLRGVTLPSHIESRLSSPGEPIEVKGALGRSSSGLKRSTMKCVRSGGTVFSRCVLKCGSLSL